MSENTFEIVVSLEDYRAFTSLLTDGPIFVAAQHSGDQGVPRSFPCLVKIIRTGVTNVDGTAPFDAYLLAFFYAEDARALLNIGSRKMLEGYNYAEAQPEAGE